jgi:hypothetical protein
MMNNHGDSMLGEVIHTSAKMDQKPGVGSVDLCCTACCTCSAASVSGGIAEEA